mmetsp:Transcript_46528/g.129686  ORF Transcript_46528/g.129686 Transcript_46528/m.129686 type:complete len:221 (+) Transcript_46528:286-948(+)
MRAAYTSRRAAAANGPLSLSASSPCGPATDASFAPSVSISPSAVYLNASGFSSLRDAHTFHAAYSDCWKATCALGGSGPNSRTALSPRANTTPPAARPSGDCTRSVLSTTNRPAASQVTPASPPSMALGREPAVQSTKSASKVVAAESSSFGQTTISPAPTRRTDVAHLQSTLAEASAAFADSTLCGGDRPRTSSPRSTSVRWAREPRREAMEVASSTPE